MLSRHLPPRLALLLLLPLIAIIVPLISRQRATEAGVAPPHVRQCLERVLSEGESPPPPLSRLWSEEMWRVSGTPSRTWCGERYDRKGHNVQAIYDEATDRVIMLSREMRVSHEVSHKDERAEDSDMPVRDADSAKAVALGFLRLLPSSDRQGGDKQSWPLTAKSMRLGVNEPGETIWFVRGSHNGHTFDIHIESETGCILFYSEGKFTKNAVLPALAPGL